MADTKTAWAEVGDRLSALSLKLKLHAEEELSDEDVRKRSGVDKLSAVIEETAEAISDAYEDEAVRSDAKELARAFVDALDATMRDVEARVRGTG
jgi:hypothetical protein